MKPLCFGSTHQGFRQADGDALELLRPTRPAHSVPVHRHDDAHLVLVLRGRYESDAAPAPTSSPQLIVNPPRTEHQDRFAAGQRLSDARFIALGIAPARWARWQRAQDLPARPSVHALTPSGIWSQALLAGPALLDDCLAEALASARDPERDAPAWLERARLLLREQALDAAGPPDLAGLAQHLRVHPGSLARAFRRRWGLSPGAYQLSLRMDQAAAALLRPTAPALAELALQAGFCDQAHFNRAFRAVFGLAPRAWRQQRVKNVQDAGRAET